MDFIIPISNTIIFGCFILSIHNLGMRYLNIKQRNILFFEKIIPNIQRNIDIRYVNDFNNENENEDDEYEDEDDEDDEDEDDEDEDDDITNNPRVIKTIIDKYITGIDMKMNRGKPSCIFIPNNCNVEDVPDEYKCPISKELMRDPVVASDGHTYEREWIEKIMSRNGYSPITREEFLFPFLIPNWNIRIAIEDYINKQLNRI